MALFAERRISSVGLPLRQTQKKTHLEEEEEEEEEEFPAAKLRTWRGRRWTPGKVENLSVAAAAAGFFSLGLFAKIGGRSSVVFPWA